MKNLVHDEFYTRYTGFRKTADKLTSSAAELTLEIRRIKEGLAMYEIELERQLVKLDKCHRYKDAVKEMQKEYMKGDLATCANVLKRLRTPSDVD